MSMQCLGMAQEAHVARFRSGFPLPPSHPTMISAICSGELLLGLLYTYDYRIHMFNLGLYIVTINNVTVLGGH